MRRSDGRATFTNYLRTATCLGLLSLTAAGDNIFIQTESYINRQDFDGLLKLSGSTT